MAETTHIEWTDATWNIITGCTLVDEGCRHCYAARLAATRLQHHPSRAGLARLNAQGEAKFTGEVRFNDQWLDQPLRWKKGRMIFVCAHGDLFHETVPDDWIDKVFAVMALAPQHTFQVLTKRPDRMRAYMKGLDHPPRKFDVVLAAKKAGALLGDLPDVNNALGRLPLPNVWLGTSISDQPSADLRIPDLLATPAAVRFLSAEPLLGPVDTEAWLHDDDCFASRQMSRKTGDRPLCHCGEREGRKVDLDWLIVGGESGPNARPMHPDWARSLRDQCTAAGVAFFFKQWGEWTSIYDRDRDDPDWRDIPNCGDWDKKRWLNFAGGQGFHGDKLNMMQRDGKARAGRLLDGREHNDMPGVAQ